MTAIVALVENGKIYMGGDSAGVSGLRLTVRKDEKVFINSDFIIGFTTSFRMGSLLRYSFNPPEKPRDFTDEEFMNTKFVDAIRECFKAGGFATSDAGAEVGGQFIVGYNKRLYTIDSDYQVGMPADPFCAAGCGIDLCLGSMCSTKGKPPRDRICTALSAAERFSAGVRGPFVVKEK